MCDGARQLDHIAHPTLTHGKAARNPCARENVFQVLRKVTPHPHCHAQSLLRRLGPTANQGTGWAAARPRRRADVGRELAQEGERAATVGNQALNERLQVCKHPLTMLQDIGHPTQNLELRAGPIQSSGWNSDNSTVIKQQADCACGARPQERRGQAPRQAVQAEAVRLARRAAQHALRRCAGAREDQVHGGARGRPRGGGEAACLVGGPSLLDGPICDCRCRRSGGCRRHGRHPGRGIPTLGRSRPGPGSGPGRGLAPLLGHKPSCKPPGDARKGPVRLLI
mmetsp:Transcript_87835/g.251633  ORF Transcript_87835/g.251633 Transcript_87835/m.251633 type:complete len:282 (+) Transcript_87835:439-1284(+)